MIKTKPLFNFRMLGLVLLMAATLMTMRAHAFTWHTANQNTVAWDAVTTLDDGSAIPTDNTVEYAVFLVNSDTDPQKQNPAMVWRGPGTSTLITLNTEGQYWVGVKAYRMLGDGTEVGESTISWSDDPGSTNDNDWGLRYFLAPAKPGGLKPN